MSKASLFRPLDLVFAAPAILSGALTAYAYSNGTTGQALAMLIVLTLCFAGIYVALLIYRAKFLAKITFSTKHGLHVIANGFVVSQEEVERITEETILAWTKVLSEIDKEDYTTRCRDCIKDVFVSFESFPINDNRMGKLAGYAVGDNIVIGYKENLDETALAHELGHYMHKEFLGGFDNVMCHSFMKVYKLK